MQGLRNGMNGLRKVLGTGQLVLKQPRGLAAVYRRVVVTPTEHNRRPDVCLEYDEQLECRRGRKDHWREDENEICYVCEKDVFGKPVIVYTREQDDSYYREIVFRVCCACVNTMSADLLAVEAEFADLSGEA